MSGKRFVLFVAVLSVCFGLSAQVYSPQRKLFTLETAHFTIIFPEECRASAEYLQGMADGVYAEVAGKLNVKQRLRLPVMITPDSEDLNGYTSFLPLRIVLFQAPISPNSGFAEYNDELKKLFMHELTHAVSMTVSSPFWHFLSALFCPDFPVAAVNSPYSFIEGVTVSFESADGYGRANDTPYAAIIRQDIIEGKFKSFAEAAGAWGSAEYPFGIQYVYGGYFSKYLQETYGMEKYAELWRLLGKCNVFTGFEGLYPFKGAFEKAYGLSVDTAWNDFRGYMSIGLPVVTELHPVSAAPDYFYAVASDGRRVYVADTQWVWSYDPESRETARLFASDGSITRLFPSPDGKKLLVSQYRAGAGARPKAMIRAYDIEAKRFEKTAFPGKLLEAAWLPDGSVVAARIIGYGQDLVRIRDGKEEVLFHGTEKRCPSQPYPYGDGEIVFILQQNGENSVVRMNLATKEMSILKTGDEIRRLRNLYSDGTEIAFSFDSSDSLLTLARLSGSGLEIENALLSGGVQYPVLCGGAVFYAGFFSDGHMLLRYAEENPALALEAVPSSWEKFEARPDETASVYDRVPSQKSGTYSPIPWLFRSSLRYPEISMNDDRTAINGAGFYSQSMDPTESYAVAASAVYLWNSQFVNASLKADAYALPVPVSVTASDTLSVASGSAVYGSELVRTLNASMNFAKTAYLVPSSRSVGGAFGGGVSYTAEGEGKTDGLLLGEAVDSPYGWELTDVFFPVAARLSWRDVRESPFNDRGAKGFSLTAGYDGYFPNRSATVPMGVINALAGIYIPFMNFTSVADAAFATGPDVLVGTTGAFLADGTTYLGTDSYAEYEEYSSLSAVGSWLYLYQDTGISREFMTHSPLTLDLYMRSIGLGGGYRSACADWEYLHSVYAYVDLNFCISRGILSTLLPMRARIELAKPLSGDDRSPQIRFMLSLQL